MHSSFNPTPTHTMRLDGPSEWPLPPFASRDPWGEAPASAPVVIETRRGHLVEGEMLAFDVKRESMIFRFDEHGGALRVQFRRFRKLTLLQPLGCDDAAREVRVQFASHMRKYKIALTGNGRLTGRTAGHVENRAGLFLFTPDDEARTLQRSFVPSGAYTHCVLGPSVEEDAAQRWIDTPQALAAALDESQSKRKAIAIGEAIFDLGVISARQLSATLAAQDETKRVPVGEMLVAEGLLSRADLRTALGHKMGYPLVNVHAYPLSSLALGKMPMDLAFECNALPLMLRGQQIVVAMDNLARVAQLASMPCFKGFKIVPVLARQTHIESALLRAYHELGQSGWAEPQQSWKLTSPMMV